MTDEAPPKVQLPDIPASVVKSLHGYMSRNLQCCGNCNAFREDTSRKGGGIGICAAHTPQPILVAQMAPSMHPGAGGMQQTQSLQGIWPPTERRRWCREWQALEESANAGTN